MNIYKLALAFATATLSLSAVCGELEDGFKNPPADAEPKASQEATGDVAALKLLNDAALLAGKDDIACNPAWPGAKELIRYVARCRYLFRASKAADKADAGRTFKDGTVGFFATHPTDKKSAAVSLDFPVTGKHPELWDPATGRILRPSKSSEAGGRTTVVWNADPGASVFVMFRPQPSSAKKAPKILASQIQDVEVTGTWDPEPTPDTAFANKTFRFSEGCFRLPGYATMAWIDLGKAKGVFEIKVNGKKFPTLWKPPYRLNIADALSFEADGHSTEPGADIGQQAELNVELKANGSFGTITWQAICD